MIGILAIQGSVEEHEAVLRRIGVDFILVKNASELNSISHLIILGGESSAMIKLLEQFGMWEILQERTRQSDIKIFGTCAGAILCGKLGMDIDVERNGYGSQLDSFAESLESDAFPELKGIFIRAPKLKNIGSQVEIMAKFREEPVLLSQNNFLIASFHPELTNDARIHEYFLKQ